MYGIDRSCVGTVVWRSGYAAVQCRGGVGHGVTGDDLDAPTTTTIILLSCLKSSRVSGHKLYCGRCGNAGVGVAARSGTVGTSGIRLGALGGGVGSGLGRLASTGKEGQRQERQAWRGRTWEIPKGSGIGE